MSGIEVFVVAAAALRATVNFGAFQCSTMGFRSNRRVGPVCKTSAPTLPQVFVRKLTI